MPSIDEQRDRRPADTVLSAELEPRGGPVLLRAARQAVYVLTELTGGVLPQPSLSNLVVRRTADGEVVLSLPAGDLPAAHQLLHHVREQLRQRTVGDFLDRWQDAPEAG